MRAEFVAADGAEGVCCLAPGELLLLWKSRSHRLNRPLYTILCGSYCLLGRDQSKLGEAVGTSGLQPRIVASLGGSCPARTASY